MANNAFSIAIFFVNILLTIVYFSKERIDTAENRIYSCLSIASITESVLAILSYVTIMNRADFPILNEIVSKSLIFVMFIWIILITIYIFVIASFDNKISKLVENIIRISAVIFIIVVGILIIINPLNYFSSYNVAYSYGPCADVVYTSVGICFAFCFIVIITNFKKALSKKIIPFFVFITLAAISVIFQKIHPELLLMTAVIGYTTLMMYFTIENPDVKMNEQLKIARDEADKANQAKSDFLSNMSHEIRTPLNAIVGFSQALEEEDLPAQAKEEVGDIISASESLLEIVNGILDISKIEANKLDIINTEYSFRKVFKELINLTKARMGDSKLEFRYSMDETIPKVLYGDHARVKQVILNLLTNAVKYTKEGYLDFKVSSVVQGDICRLIISVEDSGIGIKKEALGKLFSKFERLGVEKEITIEGTGLGLAITKKLVELMKGEIVVQSVYGKGSRFTIALDQRIVLGKDELFEEHEQELKMIDCTGKNILVVDDNPVNLKVAKRLLDDYKANITLLGSGFEAIDNIKAGNVYDLILMDDMMPKMNGTETMKKLHEIEGFNMPIIALTANAISGMKEKYINAGFDDYLPKPIQKIELNQAIDKFLGQNK